MSRTTSIDGNSSNMAAFDRFTFTITHPQVVLVRVLFCVFYKVCICVQHTTIHLKFRLRAGINRVSPFFFFLTKSVNKKMRLLQWSNTNSSYVQIKFFLDDQNLVNIIGKKKKIKTKII
jgi:hypothetical protein